MELHFVQFRNGLHQFLKGPASMGKAIMMVVVGVVMECVSLTMLLVPVVAGGGVVGGVGVTGGANYIKQSCAFIM